MLFEYFVDLQSEAGERTRRSQQRQVEGRIKKKNLHPEKCFYL